jgi:hypothetical protein
MLRPRPQYRLRALATALLLVLALTLLACGDDEAPSIGGLIASHTPTPTPFGGVLGTGTPTSGTSTSLPAGSTPTPFVAPGATSTPTPAVGKPRVLWMLRSSGGTNLAVVRFATNVETTAVLSLSASPGTQTFVDPQPAPTFAKEHTISIPLGQGVPVFLSLEVTDHEDRKAVASLETGATIVGTQYWGRAEGFRPVFTWTGPFKGTATWSNILGAPPAPPDGTVQIFGKKAGCTTAEQCQAAPISVATNDTRTTFEGGEKHTIPLSLPSTPDQDFQLLYTVIIDNGGQVISLFYQRDVLRAAAVAGKD